MLEQKTSQESSLIQSTTTLSFITAISRILGFARDMIVAQFFGATMAVDAFYVAFRIPNFMRGLFAEGAFAQAFVPILTEYQQQKSFAEIKLFVQRLQGCLGVLLFLVVLLGLVFTPLITHLFAPGFAKAGPQFELTNSMLRLTLPYLFFITLTAFFSSLLNTYHRFAIPAFAPIILNVIMISAAVWISPNITQNPIMVLAYAVLIAGVTQFLFQLPFLAQQNLLVYPRIGFRDPGVVRVLKRLLPAIFGVSVAQISLIIDSFFASFLAVGSITWLYYSDRLILFPLGIFGVALSTVVLPNLAKHFSKQSQQEFFSVFNWAMQLVIMIAIPAAIGLFVLAKPLFITLFQYGEFTQRDAILSSYSLQAYACGIPGFMLVKVLASGFYARQDIARPFRFAIVALLINIFLSALLMLKFAHVGLAAATSVAISINALLLIIYFKKYHGAHFNRNFINFIFRIVAASVAMIAFLFVFTPDSHTWFSWSGSKRGLNLAMLILFSMAVYFLSLSQILFKLIKNFKVVKTN
jgi:putative peptidoglycan lipid II flippase